MIEFGKTLRAAREAKGLSVAQLAEMTHMTPARVEELETENFTSIPAAIYGRGFVRLYCSAVGLDPKPLSDEFTEIFNGNRELEIRERTPEPEPIPTAREERTREEFTRRHGDTETSDAGVDSLGRDSNPTPPTSVPPCLRVSPTSEETLPASSDDLFAEPTTTSEPHPSSDRLRGSLCSGDTSLRVSPSPEEPAAERGPTLSRYAAPLHDRPKLAVPASVWRLALLGCAALLVLWALALGVRALYRATGGAPSDTPTTEAATTETSPTSAKAESKPTPPAESPAPARPADGPRTPQAIPALYVD